jgi:hypothetical protein
MFFRDEKFSLSVQNSTEFCADVDTLSTLRTFIFRGYAITNHVKPIALD